MNAEKVKTPAVIRLYQLSQLMSAKQHARGRVDRGEMVELMTEFHSLKSSNKDDWDEFCKLKQRILV
jgi:hypothetical protein